MQGVVLMAVLPTIRALPDSGKSVVKSELLGLENEKLTLPSFSLRVEGAKDKKNPTAPLLDTPVYFPYLPKRERVQQNVPITFPLRGAYRQDTFRILTRFPFGFLQKAWLHRCII